MDAPVTHKQTTVSEDKVDWKDFLKAFSINVIYKGCRIFQL